MSGKELFKEGNVKATLQPLFTRLCELQELTEWFDGSPGEITIMEEIRTLQGVMEACKAQTAGLSCKEYYGLKTPEEFEDEKPVFDEIRETCNVSEYCENCEHWTRYHNMPGDDVNLSGECNNFTRPDECLAFIELSEKAGL